MSHSGFHEKWIKMAKCYWGELKLVKGSEEYGWSHMFVSFYLFFFQAYSVVQWLAHSAHDREIPGSIPWRSGDGRAVSLHPRPSYPAVNGNRVLVEGRASLPRWWCGTFVWVEGSSQGTQVPNHRGKAPAQYSLVGLAAPDLQRNFIWIRVKTFDTV